MLGVGGTLAEPSHFPPMENEERGLVGPLASKWCYTLVTPRLTRGSLQTPAVCRSQGEVLSRVGRAADPIKRLWTSQDKVDLLQTRAGLG